MNLGRKSGDAQESRLEPEEPGTITQTPAGSPGTGSVSLYGSLDGQTDHNFTHQMFINLSTWGSKSDIKTEDFTK